MLDSRGVTLEVGQVAMIVVDPYPERELTPYKPGALVLITKILGPAQSLVGFRYPVRGEDGFNPSHVSS